MKEKDIYTTMTKRYKVKGNTVANDEYVQSQLRIFFFFWSRLLCDVFVVAMFFFFFWFFFWKRLFTEGSPEGKLLLAKKTTIRISQESDCRQME